MTKKHKEATEETLERKDETKPASRRIFLFGRLENEVALPIIKRLLRLNDRDDKTPIDLYINSSGGNGYNADAIIAVMHAISAPVNTICLGHALSGACEILASGTGERAAYEFSTLMFHQTLWEADGDITNLEIQAMQGQRFRDAQIELLHRCTRKDKAQIRKDIERDYYMSAQEAVKYGIIDKIIQHSQSKSKGISTNAGVNRIQKASVTKEYRASALSTMSGKVKGQIRGAQANSKRGRAKNG